MNLTLPVAERTINKLINQKSSITFNQSLVNLGNASYLKRYASLIIMNRVFVILMLLTCISPVRGEVSSSVPPCMFLQGVAAPLKKVFDQKYPTASIQYVNDTWVVSFSTQSFTVHDISMTGEISAVPHESVGPSFKGFQLILYCLPKDYSGQAVTPQTIRYPYWHTYLDQFVCRKSDTKLFMSFSYGSRISPDLLKEIRETVRNFCQVAP